MSTTEDCVTPNGVEPLPVIVPVAAPVHIGAAAYALAYAIEVLAGDFKEGASAQELRSADGIVSQYRRVLEDAGWRLRGPVNGNWEVGVA